MDAVGRKKKEKKTARAIDRKTKEKEKFTAVFASLKIATPHQIHLNIHRTTQKIVHLFYSKIF